MKENSSQGFLRRNYHWIIAGAAFLQFFVAVGLANNIYTLFQIPVSESLNISRSTFSLSSSIKCFAAFCSNLLFGTVYRRFGYRRMAAIALCLGALAYLGYSLSENIVPFYLGAAVVGLCEPYLSTAGVSRLITDWFHRHQGLVLGIVMASSGVGGTVFGLLMTGLMEKDTWRLPLRAASVVLAVTALLVFLIVRSKPENLNLQPYGDVQDRWHTRERRHHRSVENASDWAGIPFSRLLRTPLLYLLLFATLLMGFSLYGVFHVLVSHLRDQGMSAMDAASVQGVMFVALALAKVLEGLLCDRFGAKPVMIGSMMTITIGIGMLLVCKSVLGISAAVSIFAIGLSIPSIMVPVLTSELFGRRDFGSLLGVQQALVSLSSMAAFPLMSLVFERYGGYTPGFCVLVGISLFTILLYLLVFRGAAKERRLYQAAQERRLASLRKGEPE